MSNACPATRTPTTDGPAEAVDRLARWAAAIEARRPLLRRLGLAFSLLIISVSAVLFVRTLVRIDLQQFKAAFAATGGDQIATAFGLSALELSRPDRLRRGGPAAISRPTCPTG